MIHSLKHIEEQPPTGVVVIHFNFLTDYTFFFFDVFVGKVWIGNNTNNVTADIEIVPTEITAVLTDFPGLRSSELFVKKYENVVMPGVQVSEGLDKVYSIYNDIIANNPAKDEGIRGSNDRDAWSRHLQARW